MEPTPWSCTLEIGTGRRKRSEQLARRSGAEGHSGSVDEN